MRISHPSVFSRVDLRRGLLSIDTCKKIQLISLTFLEIYSKPRSSWQGQNPAQITKPRKRKSGISERHKRTYQTVTPTPWTTNTVWCIYLHCLPSYAPGNRECLLQEEEMCDFMQHVWKHLLGLREVLTLAIRARFDIRAEDYSSNSYRKAAYREYCLWKYGKLGKGNRRVLPS